MFAKSGYDSVSIRDIAKAVKIKESFILNNIYLIHFVIKWCVL